MPIKKIIISGDNKKIEHSTYIDTMLNFIVFCYPF